MRNLTTRFMSLLVCAFLAAALFVPSVSAQDAAEAEECFETVVTTAIEIDIVTFTLPGEPGDDYNNITGTESLTARRGVEREVELETQVSVPCVEEDEVLGIVQTPLAVTGSNVSLPVMIGFSLIGAGGLAVFAAKKRQEHAS